MNFRTTIRKALPYLAAIVVFWVVSAIYFAPQFAGETLQMHDVQMYDGMKGDITAHRAAFGEDPQWTGGMFGGMPAYLITVRYPAMILRNAVQWAIGLMGEPAALMFLAMLGFWLMLLMCGVNAWLAIPFALAYGLSTYNILIIEAGHITKMRAMGYAPMLVGAVFYTFKGGAPTRTSSAPACHAEGSKATGNLPYSVWVGGALSALFGALLIAASHHQITYYFLLVVVAFWINELVSTARASEGWRRFCISTAVVAGSAVLAVGANFTHLWYTLEHSPETIRGGSEVAASDGTGGTGTTGGLDLDYATAWSYGTGESFNMFIPNLRGGSSSDGFSADGPVATVLRRSGYDPAIATQLPGYWGTQPVTGGPTYLGAVMVFLFVLGMFVLPARVRWWVLAVSVFALLLAWGRNAMWFTELAFAGLPGYNKFRTVAMALAVLQWSVPFVGALVASGLWRGQFSDKARFMRGLAWSVGLTGGVALLFALGGGMMYDFSAPSDSYYDGIPGLVDAVRTERAALLRADSWRSLLFVVLTAGVVWAWISRHSWQSSWPDAAQGGLQGEKSAQSGGAKGISQSGKSARSGGSYGKKIGENVGGKTSGARRWIPVAALSVLVLADLVPVDLRFLSHDEFHSPARVEVVPDEVDLAIMADTEPGFRVLNTQDPFNEAYTSYFHRSVGGYHAAKLRRYQDVIDRYLSHFHLGVLGMLNTKYFIVNDPATGERTAELNPDAFGAAWFVDSLQWVDGAAAELDALGVADLRHEAVVDLKFREKAAPEFENSFSRDKYRIDLTEYRPNYLKYDVSAPTERVAVFSEIYYDKGWTAYLDGEPTPYFRADYILRAMVIPAGDHTVEWRFRAPRFATVEGVTLTCSIVILLWLVAVVVVVIRKQTTRNN